MPFQCLPFLHYHADYLYVQAYKHTRNTLKLAHYKVFYTCKRYILIIIIHYVHTCVYDALRYKRRPKNLFGFRIFAYFYCIISILKCGSYTATETRTTTHEHSFIFINVSNCVCGRTHSYSGRGSR